MGIDDTERSHKIQDEHVINYIDKEVKPESPIFGPFFESYNGLRKNGDEHVQAIIGWTRIIPERYDLNSKEGRAELYWERMKVTREAGLIGEKEKLYYKSKEYKSLRTVSNDIREQARTLVKGTKVVKAEPGQVGTSRQKTQRLRPQRAF
jgi:transposase-like protein